MILQIGHNIESTYTYLNSPNEDFDEIIITNYSAIVETELLIVK